MTSKRLASVEGQEAAGALGPAGRGPLDSREPGSPSKAGSGQRFDFSSASKFPAGTEYFDVNYLWVPGLRWVVAVLHRTPVRPEVVLGLSFAAGCMSAFFFLKPGYRGLVLGAALMQIKNYLDTVDGHLARAKGIDSPVGRFLDSLSDFVIYAVVFTALGIRLRASGGWLMLAFAYGAMVSAFLQCSYYNYYLVAYLRRVGRTQSRNDERISGEDDRGGGVLLRVLRGAYLVVYGWQDRLIARVDRSGRRLAGKRGGRSRSGPRESAGAWYADKRMLAANSPLCFGTQILALSVCSLAGRPSLFFFFVLVPANLYLLLLAALRPRLISDP